MNGDGKKDLILGYDTGKIVYYENLGTNASPVFNGYEYLESDGADIDLYIGTRIWIDDWDEDGILDMLVSDFDGWVYLYPGYSTGIAEDESQSMYSHLDVSILENPAGGLFTAEVTLPAPGNTVLSVYSLDGRRVESLDLSNLQAGLHSLIIDISKQCEGTYFLTVQSGAVTATEKLVLLN